MGSVLHFMGDSGETRLRMYISGDTLVIDDLGDIPKRLGDIDLAVLHLGGTRVFGVTVTMNGEQGVRLMKMIRPEITIPVHFDDYDVFHSPLSDFEAAVTKAKLDDHVRIMKRGESLVFALPAAGPDLPSAERGDGVTYLSDSRTGRRSDGQSERRSA
jgi:L-ascorbate metabolism protein UlaG (beta-lactamase superfamily)